MKMKEYIYLDGTVVQVPDDTCRGCYLESQSDCIPEIIPPPVVTVDSFLAESIANYYSYLLTIIAYISYLAEKMLYLHIMLRTANL